jgi:hypothetical protein
MSTMIRDQNPFNICDLIKAALAVADGSRPRRSKLSLTDDLNLIVDLPPGDSHTS